ncbi:MAG: phosphomannomutase, partial [Clostridia bacterium]
MINKYNFRGIVGEDLTEKNIEDYAKRIVKYINKNGFSTAVIVGKDNRVSSDYILSILCKVLLKNGIDVNLIGLSTTPQLVYLTQKFKFDIGLMITASHNSWEYNGIKCF